MGTIDIIIIVAYMLGMIGVGIYANTKIQTTEDFVLGGKRFGTLSLTGTIMATMMGKMCIRDSFIPVTYPLMIFCFAR